MKKTLRLILCCCIAGHGFYANGQGLTQSADGSSTIPIRGAAVGIDIAKTELSFGYNNVDREVAAESIRGIYGVLVKVKNEEGIGNLFSSGDLVPAGSLSFFGGFTLSNVFNRADKNEMEIRRELTADYIADRDQFRKSLSVAIAAKIQSIAATIPDAANQSAFKSEAEANFAAVGATKENFYDSVKMKNLRQSNEVLADAWSTLIAFAQKMDEDWSQVRATYDRKRRAIYDKVSTGSKNHQRVTVFGFGGISAISFKKFNAIDSANLSKSFSDINERGGNIGIGLNYQPAGFLWLGATYSYVATNNFSVLRKKNYTLRTTTAINNQVLLDESSITGYAGKYGTVECNNFNVDIVFRVKLDKSDTSFVLINPYLRASLFSRDTSLLPNKVNIGTGFYFMQGKFLGGFYIELPDVNNSLEKMKAPEDQNLKPPLKRLTFGLVTKFNLSTIMGW